MSGVEYDVAIVGCGPVGAIAANLFGHAGLRTLVIERDAEPYPLPRAVHIDHEMMRIFQSVGLADAVLPLMREAHGHVHIGADGGVIRYLGSAGLPKRFGWANDYFFFQPELERAMEQGLGRFPHVELRRGVTIAALVQTSPGVTLTTQSADGERRVDARHVVACDGANSFVRKTLGIPLADMQFHEPWLVVDAEVDGPISFPTFAGAPVGADLQRLSVMLCDPKRPATLVPGRRNHRRWEFMLLPGEDDTAMMQGERVAALVAPYVRGTPHRIIRAATYRFHGLVAERWQDGRVFLAGDAAHQTPPFFGQGMCHGVRDVANLAWKFALITQGKASPALLDTYQAEREPHVRAVIEAAIAAGRYICERDPTAARKRDETLREAMGQPAPASASDLIPPLRSGIVSAADQPGRGARFIQPRVAFNGRRMLLDDATGGGFVLLASSRAVLAALSAGQWELWTELSGKSFVIDRDTVDAGSIHDADGDLNDWLTARGAVAVLIRPDFYVYGVASSARALGAMIEELAAALRVAG
jgi:3-(3-hydroxy-phenyl)propionate hydroxylase